jgi:hypothetical protein
MKDKRLSRIEKALGWAIESLEKNQIENALTYIKSAHLGVQELIELLPQKGSGSLDLSGCKNAPSILPEVGGKIYR